MKPAYIIVKSPTIEEFQILVNEQLANGYHCQGGVLIWEGFLIQAMNL